MILGWTSGGCLGVRKTGHAGSVRMFNDLIHRNEINLDDYRCESLDSKMNQFRALGNHVAAASTVLLYLSAVIVV